MTIRARAHQYTLEHHSGVAFRQGNITAEELEQCWRKTRKHYGCGTSEQFALEQGSIRAVVHPSSGAADLGASEQCCNRAGHYQSKRASERGSKRADVLESRGAAERKSMGASEHGSIRAVVHQSREAPEQWCSRVGASEQWCIRKRKHQAGVHQNRGASGRSCIKAGEHQNRVAPGRGA